MKQLLTFFVCSCLAMSTGWSQTPVEKNNDWAWLKITPVIAQQSDPLSENLSGILLSKMGQLLDANKLGSVSKDAPFNMAATLVVNQTDVARTTPVRYSVSCTLTFQILDAKTGNVYGAITRDLRGIGSNKDNAIRSALTGINARASYFKVFVDGAKSKIKESYEPQTQPRPVEATKVAAEEPAATSGVAPADEASPVAAATAPKHQKLSLSKTIVMEYLGAEKYGQQLYLYFALTNSGNKNEEIELHDMAIFDKVGTYYRIKAMAVGNAKETYRNYVMLVPTIRTLIKCVFPTIDSVPTFQFTYEGNSFSFPDLSLTPPAEQQ